ncbi:hypothetical protein [Stieleria varia]|uniref:Uncharacterized protein n=1 Tax=Stieleria varia TaxID=2528005 RepID=A0A5C5ZW39_9BACT|nr:hypothetical protein [Stieleria varia]TWT91258.1 hypothetical protein Pla52n_66700 [Stieleria varia]
MRLKEPSQVDRRIPILVAVSALMLLLVLSINGGTLVVGAEADATSADATSADATSADAMELPESLQPKDFDATDIAVANSWAESLHLADWLGPLAPLALSPFFGITCLSGLALWGPEWIKNNALLGSTGPLQNEVLFGVFLVLTVLTSLPRLTKVSKPFAQAVDQLETYSVIVILLVIKFLADSGAAHSGNAGEVAMVQLGVLSFTVETLLAFAMVVNVIVINCVKFFFELLVWLTPIPFLDAVFEVCNKALCGLLMAVYAFSPTIATVINLIVLVLAAIILRWTGRRMRFYRTIFLDPVIARVWRSYACPDLRLSGGKGIVVFPKDSGAGLVAKSRWRLFVDDDGWVMRPTGWLPGEDVRISSDCRPMLTRGWFMHGLSAKLADGTPVVLNFSRRFDGQWEILVQQGRFELGDEAQEPLDRGSAAAEFA